MFEKPFFGNGAVVSSEGFSVLVRDRYGLLYKEGDLTVDVSCDTVPPNMDVLHGTASATRNGTWVKLTNEEDRQVFERISAALAWDGYTVCVVG